MTLTQYAMNCRQIDQSSMPDPNNPDQKIICTVLLGYDGYPLAVFTSWNADTNQYRSEYYWVWPKVIGFKSSWLIGDPLTGINDGQRWIRWEAKMVAPDPKQQVNIHLDAVEHIRVLYGQGYTMPPAYGGTSLKGLWDNSAEVILKLYTPHNIPQRNTTHA